jgi:hypothetical protein
MLTPVQIRSLLREAERRAPVMRRHMERIRKHEAEAIAKAKAREERIERDSAEREANRATMERLIHVRRERRQREADEPARARKPTAQSNALRYCEWLVPDFDGGSHPCPARGKHIVGSGKLYCLVHARAYFRS